ncbi:hypothetical protein PAHAL_9G401200 [Panicum hallii]|uniref:Uncharacterized protein n=1 Tax=Panicum hallii TaxID=206008 RepID=A0A2T8I458_9POAL|nr:hypothetical protein PAHAL_9G401200 [Panicum hallii]
MDVALSPTSVESSLSPTVYLYGCIQEAQCNGAMLCAYWRHLHRFITATLSSKINELHF